MRYRWLICVLWNSIPLSFMACFSLFVKQNCAWFSFAFHLRSTSWRNIFEWPLNPCLRIQKSPFFAAIEALILFHHGLVDISFSRHFPLCKYFLVKRAASLTILKFIKSYFAHSIIRALQIIFFQLINSDLIWIAVLCFLMKSQSEQKCTPWTRCSTLLVHFESKVYHLGAICSCVWEG